MPPHTAPTADRVEQALSSESGQAVRVRGCVVLEPWSVARCQLAEPLPDGPTSVIVKWVRTGAGDERTQPSRLRTERAALEFVAERAPGLVPRVLAGLDEDDGGLLMLEDLAPREPLRELLLRVGPVAAQPQLTAFARALGRLHATTAGGTGPDIAAGVDTSIGQWQVGVDLLRRAGVPMSTAASSELSSVTDGLLRPDAFLALSSGDPETNNYLTDGSDGRLIDFESAAFQHVFVDVASMYLPGPMWLTVGDPGTDGRADAYRTEVAAAIPAIADDDVFGLGTGGAGLVFAIRRLVSLPKLDVREPGESGRLHRVATTEAAAAVAERFGTLPHLSSWARTVAGFLRRRWPDTDVDLTVLPPFTSR